MADTSAARFIEALNALESNREADPIAALFTGEAEVGNVIAPEKFHGTDGAREFWTKYRDTFENVHSTFRNQIVGENRIALEWKTECTSLDGAQIAYGGVSILELSGNEISRFCAYFDPAALGRQMETAASGGTGR